MPTGRQPGPHRLPVHHPADELLAAYAAGSLPESVELVIATHLALCPACRAAVAGFEAIGGALLEALPAAPLPDHSLDMLLDRLEDEPAAGPAPPAAPEAGGAARVPEGGLLLPRPLRDYLPQAAAGATAGATAEPGLAALPWRTVLRGVDEVEVRTESDGLRPKLMRVRAGRALPIHTHRGEELILVLAGGFVDETGHYLRGDLSHADQAVEHRPVADAGADCVCLTVSTARMRLTGPVGRFFNFLVRD